MVARVRVRVRDLLLPFEVSLEGKPAGALTVWCVVAEEDDQEAEVGMQRVREAVRVRSVSLALYRPAMQLSTCG